MACSDAGTSRSESVFVTGPTVRTSYVIGSSQVTVTAIVSSPQAEAFQQLAQAVAARVSVMSFQAAPELKII